VVEVAFWLIPVVQFVSSLDDISIISVQPNLCGRFAFARAAGPDTYRESPCTRAFGNEKDEGNKDLGLTAGAQ